MLHDCSMVNHNPCFFAANQQCYNYNQSYCMDFPGNVWCA